MRSSEDDACCDMLIASPEAPDRRGNLDHRKYDASSFHGKERKACYCSCRVELGFGNLGPCILSSHHHERRRRTT
jgi:hypothetical protein